MKCEVTKCDVCGIYGGHTHEVVVTDAAPGDTFKTKKDLCESCVERLCKFIERGLSKPTPRKKGADAK